MRRPARRPLGWLSAALLAALLVGGVFFKVRAVDRNTRQQLMRAVVRLLAADVQDGRLVVISTGSGTVISPDGLILTNLHVISNLRARRLHQAVGVAFTRAFDEEPRLVCFANPAHARIDPALDLALIRCEVDAQGNPLSRGVVYPSIPLGESGTLVPGDRIEIVGYPGVGGKTINFTAGEVSGFVGEAGGAGRDWIKTAAFVAGGNSGGAALDEQGKLVGVPTQFGPVERRGDLQVGKLTLVRPIAKALPLIRGERGQAAGGPPTGPGTGPGAGPGGMPPGSPGLSQSGVIVFGRLVAADSGAPVAGATVLFLRPGVKVADLSRLTMGQAVVAAASSDSNGHFRLQSPLPRGAQYGVAVVAQGFRMTGQDGALRLGSSEPALFSIGTILLQHQ